MLERDRRDRRVAGPTVMLTNRIERRVVAALAVLACCLFLAAGAALAAPSTDDRTSADDIAGADAATPSERVLDSVVSNEPFRGAVDDRRVGGPAAQVSARTDPTRSQLFGVVLVLVVLALVGAAVWGVRPAALDRFGRPASLGRRSRDVDGADGTSAEEELLTDEERIVGLLEQNGGRLKQQHVVETTDWSKAKVSRLLSSMEDDDTIVRIQLGREKLIFLSGHEPNGVRSTLGEDR